MTTSLKGQVAVVTGGASGIGEATVRLFVEAGARCVIADRNEGRGTRIAAELGDAVVFCPTDVTVEAQMSAAVEAALHAFGRLDCMFNNAGVVGAAGSISELTLQSWERTLAIQLTGVFLGIKHASQVMRRTGSGSIVNSASIAGLRGGFGAHPYSAAKAGVIGLTMSAAAELAPSGIRVNAVAPGTIVTPLIGSLGAPLLGRELSVEEWAKRVAESSPLGRAAGPGDVAAAVAFLASAQNVTGQVLVVDGGALSAPQPAPLTQLPATDIGFDPAERGGS